MNRSVKVQKHLFAADVQQTTSCALLTKMNFTSPVSLTNENCSEEVNDWNSTGTTTSWATSSWFSSVSWFTYVNVVVLWIVFVVGTLGNILVLVVLVWRRSNRLGHGLRHSDTKLAVRAQTLQTTVPVAITDDADFEKVLIHRLVELCQFLYSVGGLRCRNTGQHPGVGGAAVASK